MEFKITGSRKGLCHCCMEEHEIKTVLVRETNRFKGVDLEYDASYYYCDKAGELYADEEMISSNDIAMKNSYRRKQGLLTSDEIASIRNNYGITQGDLCILLGWGGKTVTRYEGHQVQDIAHDTILRKLDGDPEWFIYLLESQGSQIGPACYRRYMEYASHLYEAKHDLYLKRTIRSQYARFADAHELNGNAELSLEKVIDAICFFSNSKNVNSLYKVKLMKLLWYADALSYKRREKAITGLVYQALPMGAVPIGHESIIDFKAINCEEVDLGEGTGYHFLPSSNATYENLTKEEIDILECIAVNLGKVSRDEIVQRMHRESAFINTSQRDIIPFIYARDLSVS